MGPVYYGPFEILKKISPVSYQILLPHKSSVHDVFHIDRLKLHSDQTPGLVKGRSRTLPSLLDQEYEVDCIIDERLRYGKIEYLVKWKGYSELYDSTWEPKTNLDDTASRVVAKWVKTHPIDSISERCQIHLTEKPKK